MSIRSKMDGGKYFNRNQSGSFTHRSMALGYGVVQSELPMSGILFSVQLVRHLMSTVIGGSGDTSLIVLEKGMHKSEDMIFADVQICQVEGSDEDTKEDDLPSSQDSAVRPWIQIAHQMINPKPYVKDTTKV